MIKNFFQKFGSARKPIASREDDRLKRLLNSGLTCSSCEKIHRGLFDLVVDSPLYWRGDGESQPNSEIESSSHILTKDFCIIDGKDYFVRVVLRLPIIDRQNESFGFGVWSSLSKVNFEKYVDMFDEKKRSHEGPWFGWFSNKLQGYLDTVNLKCKVHLQDNHKRPLLELEPTDHPLAIEQRNGITLGRVFEIYTANGHNFE